MSAAPRVSVGVPVYNGERHIASALDSILAQTYRDFELIVCDNASADRTGEICRQYAARDSRVRYVRNEQNIGLARNFNKCFELARGEYFKWAAHDDLLGPAFIERCVAALDSAGSSAVLAFTRTRYLAADGTPLDCERSLAGVDFADLLRLPGGVFPIFVHGLMRSDGLRRTRLHGPFVSADIVLIRELRLLGAFVEVDEELFFFRQHDVTAAEWAARRTRQGEWAYIDPSSAGRPRSVTARVFRETIAAIWRSPIGPARKARCLAAMGGFVGMRAWHTLRRGGLLRRLRGELAGDAVFYGKAG